jgi:hypothetical protein
MLSRAKHPHICALNREILRAAQDDGKTNKIKACHTLKIKSSLLPGPEWVSEKPLRWNYVRRVQRLY